jgi:hypothetical protein
MVFKISHSLVYRVNTSCTSKVCTFLPSDVLQKYIYSEITVFKDPNQMMLSLCPNILRMYVFAAIQVYNVVLYER